MKSVSPVVTTHLESGNHSSIQATLTISLKRFSSFPMIPMFRAYFYISDLQAIAALSSHCEQTWNFRAYTLRLGREVFISGSVRLRITTQMIRILAFMTAGLT